MDNPLPGSIPQLFALAQDADDAAGNRSGPQTPSGNQP